MKTAFYLVYLGLPALRLELRHHHWQKILSLSCLPFHQAGVLKYYSK